MIKRFRRWLGRQAVKAANLSFVPSWIRHSFQRFAFRNLVIEGYKGNATVFACVSILADTFPEPELWPWREGEDGEVEKVPNHELRRLLAKPNLDMGEAELMEFVITYASIGGNCYLWKQRTGFGSGRVIALWPLHDGDMQPIPGRNSEEGLVAYYVLDIGEGRTSNPFGVDRFDSLSGVAIPKSEIIHWKWRIDPLQPWRGIGALEAAAGDIDTANEIRSYIYSLLKNDAKPPFVITLMEGEEFDEDKVSRLRAQWQQRYSGSNRGLPAFLEAGMGVKELGFNLQQLEIDSLRDGPDAAICMGFRIHPVIVGALVGLKNSTYSNFEEARKALATLTLVPIWRRFASEVQQAMADEPGYGRDVKVRFDTAMVEALQQNQDELWTRVTRAWDASLITRSMALRMLGLPTTDADNVYKVGIAAVFETAGGVEAAKVLGSGNGRSPNGQNNGHFSGQNNGYLKRPLKDFPTDDGDASPRRAPRAQYQRQLRSIQALRGVRDSLEPRMTSDLENFFDDWSERATERVLKKHLVPAGAWQKQMSNEEMEQLLLLIFQQEDEAELAGILEKYALGTIEESWAIWDLMIGVESQFTSNDPAVIAALENAGTQIKNIMETTRTAVIDVLQEGHEAGQTIDQIAETLKGIITETYKNRARAIARTEIGNAQNTATAERYEVAGFDLVIVFDNGFDNSHPTCRDLDGTVQTLKWSKENPLQHPNCVRAFGVYFED